MLEVHVVEQARQEVVVADHGVTLAGFDAALVPEQHGHLHHHVVRRHRLGVIAHAEEAVVAAHPTLVAGEDHDGVFIETVFAQRVKDGPDAVIDPADLGRHAPDADDVVVVIEIGVLPRMLRVAREGREILVGVVFGPTILGRTQQQTAEAVGTVVGEIEKEGFVAVLVLLDELYPVFGPQVGHVFGRLLHLAIEDHRIVIHAAGAAARHGGPVGEAVLRIDVVAEMPFAAEAADVALRMQNAGQRVEFLQRIVGLRTHHVFAVEEGVESVLGWNQPGEIGGPGGGTDRIAGHGAHELHALGRHAIEVGRLDVLVAITAECPSPVIVGEDENQVGALLGRERFGHGKAEHQEGKQRHEGLHGWICGGTNR